MTTIAAGVLPLLTAAAIVAAPQLEQAPPPREVVDVAALVKQLGSEDFAERERATARLSTLNVDEVPPELLAALKSDNPEIRQRAAKAVRALREYIAGATARAAIARLPRHERFAARGQVDLYAAAAATVDLTADDERLWAPALKLGAKLIALDDVVPGFPEQKGVAHRGGPAMAKDFAIYRRSNPLDFVRTDGQYTCPNEYGQVAVQAAGVKAVNVRGGWSCRVARSPWTAESTVR